MDYMKERALRNEKIIVEPIMTKFTQAIETPVKSNHMFKQLTNRELFNVFTTDKFANLNDDQLEELCQEVHFRVCKDLNVKPCNLRFDFFNEMGEDYPGKYEPVTNEVVLNQIYLGFMSDLGNNVGFETLRTVVALTAYKKENELVNRMLQGEKLTDLEKLVASTKIMSRAVTSLEDLQGLRPKRFIMDDLLKPENYYARELANCYILTEMEKGNLPKSFNPSVRTTLIDNFECLDNYKGGGKKSGMVAVIENSRYTAMKYEANFAGRTSQRVCDTYKSVNESKVLINMNKLYTVQDRVVDGERSM